MNTNTRIPIFDGHNDVLFDLFDPYYTKHQRSFFTRSEHGHIDLPRAQEGGLAGGFFAVYVPKRKSHPSRKPVISESGITTPLPQELDLPYALQYATAMVGRLFELEAEAQGQLKVVRTADELADALKKGVMAAILHFEGAEAIDPELHNLHAFYRAGLRSIGLVWSRPNAFGHGVPFNFPSTPDTGDGLSEAGKALVRECNKLGVMVDLSHLNEKGFWDVEKTSDAPLVATHSNANALCASPRNLTDKQLDAVKASKGVVGLNYHIGFLRADGRSTQPTSLSEIVRHARYIADRIGVDHLALGSDFDGATMPSDLKDAAGLPKLIDALRAAGFGEADLRKIAYENWLRLLRATWKE
jgi:membrane dipeptidase